MENIASYLQLWLVGSFVSVSCSFGASPGVLWSFNCFYLVDSYACILVVVFWIKFLLIQKKGTEMGREYQKLTTGCQHQTYRWLISLYLVNFVEVSTPDISMTNFSIFGELCRSHAMAGLSYLLTSMFRVKHLHLDIGKGTPLTSNIDRTIQCQKIHLYSKILAYTDLLDQSWHEMRD